MGNSHSTKPKPQRRATIDIASMPSTRHSNQKSAAITNTNANSNNNHKEDDREKPFASPKNRLSSPFRAANNSRKHGSNMQGINILSPQPTLKKNRESSKQNKLHVVSSSTVNAPFLSPTKSSHGNLFSPSKSHTNICGNSMQNSLSTATPKRYHVHTATARHAAESKPADSAKQLFKGTQTASHSNHSHSNNNHNHNHSHTHHKSSSSASEQSKKQIHDIIVASRFKLVKKVGKGSFGVTYESQDLLTNRPVAIKLERKREDHGHKRSSSVNTREIAILQQLSECERVPSLVWHGQYKQYRVMALQLEGMNLSDLYELCDKRFSLKTIIYILIECIYCIRDIHSKGIVHRDIKPQNFIISRDPNCNKVFVIDFGLSSWFINSSGQHIEYNEECSPVGTARYASINNHRGVHQTRRDDLESIGYMIVFFMKQELPWQGLKEQGRVNKWRKIQEKKQQTSTYDLTNGLPSEFTYYLDYVKKLRYEQLPDYEKLINVFKKLYVTQGFYQQDVQRMRVDGQHIPSEYANPNDYKWNVADLIIPDWIKVETPSNEEQ